MWLNVVLVVVGLAFLIAVMAFVLNPPELWVKRAFTQRGSAKPKKQQGDPER